MTLNNEFDFDDIPGVQGDATIPENNYRKWDEGEYRVKGIHSYITVEKERNLPVFVPQGDRMVARFKLFALVKNEDGTESEVEGPPMSATQNELRMLANSFGADPKTLPEGMTSGFLISVQELSTAKGIVRKATVNKEGWVRFLEGMTPPVQNASYTWEFVKFFTKGNLEPVAFISEKRAGNNGSYDAPMTFAQFVIVSDAWGNKCGYEGYEMNVPVYDPYDGFMGSGTNLFPATKVGEKGGIPKEVQRWIAFIRLFCMPEYRTRHWEADPEKSEYGIDELANPLPVVNALAKKSGRKIVAAFQVKKTGGIKLDFETFVPYGGQAIDLDKQSEAEQRQPKELLDLVSYIEKSATPIKVFEDTPKDSPLINIEFTDEGKKWAKQYIVPAWEDLALPLDENGMRYLGKLGAHDLGSLLSHLRGDAKKEDTRKLLEDGSPF